MRRKIFLTLQLILLFGGSWTVAQDETKPRSWHDAIKTVIPDEFIQEVAVSIHEIEQKLVEALILPSNIKIFIKLVKDSKIQNKGELTRIAMSFMARKPNRFENTIESMKHLDHHTAVEGSILFAHYLKVILPKALNKNSDFLNKFYNEDDLRKINGVLYDAFQQTPTEKILWNFRRVCAIIKNVETKLTHIRNGNFTELEWKGINSTKVVNGVKDLQRIMDISGLIPVLPQLLEYTKIATVHSIDKAWDEMKGKLNYIDEKEAIDSINLITRQIKDVASKLLEYVDLEDIPEDVEKAIIYLQRLSNESAKEKLEQLMVLMPSSNDILTTIDKIKIPVASPAFNEKVKDTVKIAANLSVPSIVQDVFISAALNQTKKIDAKKVRFIIELIVNKEKVDNEVYDALKHVLINVLKRKLHVGVKFNASSFTDLLVELKKKISEIDNNKAAQIIIEHVKDFNNINPSYVASIVSDINKLLRDLFQDDLILKLVKDPRKFLEDVDKVVFKDLVEAIVDTVKIMNETTIYKRCLEFSNYDKTDRKNKVEHLMRQITDELNKVMYGNDTIKKLQIDDIKVFLVDLVQNGNVKNVCVDIKGFIKLFKMFEEGENEELANVVWVLKGKLFGNKNKEDNLNDIIDLLEAVHRVMLHQTENPDDLRVRIVMHFLKYFKNRAAIIRTTQ